MSTSTLRYRDATMPRPPDGLGRGAVLAVLVHLLLIAAMSNRCTRIASTAPRPRPSGGRGIVASR